MSIKSAPTNKELSYRLAKSLGNKLKLAFSIKQVKTFGDAFRFIEQDTYGYSTEQLASPITYTQIKDLADSLTIKLDNFYAANDYAILHPREEDKGQPEPSIIISTGTQKIIPAFQEEEVIERKHPPSYKARLYPFQQRAANDLVDDILGRGPNKPDRLRVQILSAGVGTGKTFILWEVVAQLFAEGFFDTCISPWPVAYITKASIIEQTKRVGQDIFGLDCENFAPVFNYDALRSAFGKMYIKWETKVEQGEARDYPRWKPNIHPKLFIIDECQSAKNEDSQQAKTIIAISEIPDECYCIFSSATLFTRVSEAKYLVVNCGLEI